MATHMSPKMHMYMSELKVILVESKPMRVLVRCLTSIVEKVIMKGAMTARMMGTQGERTTILDVSTSFWFFII